MNKCMTCLVSSVAVALTASAATIYVDDDNYNANYATAADYAAAGYDGSTAAKAYGTIQAAVDAAADGATIALLPGTYDKGGAELTLSKQTVSCRVCVTEGKNLTIRSTQGRAVTTIKGAFDSDDTLKPGSGVGPKAVRGIAVAPSAACTVIVEDVTISGTSAQTLDDNSAGYGSAAYASDNGLLYLVDCAICDNTGVRGTTYQTTLVRCSVHDNVCAVGKGSVSYNGQVFNSVAYRNSGDAAFTGALVVNTTLMGHTGGFLSEASTAVNCLATGYSGKTAVTSNKGKCVGTNVVYQTGASSDTAVFDETSSGLVGKASQTQCAAPFEDDFRLVTGAEAIGAGEAGLLANYAATMPTGVDLYKDYLGNVIQTSGAIAAGAVQTVITPAGGAVLFKDGIRFVGSSIDQPDWYYRYAVESYPQQWHVKAVLADGEYVVYYALPGVLAPRRFPEMDDTLWLMPPPFGSVITNDVETTTTAYWVNPTTGTDTPVAEETRGTAAAPFKTLQAAADACTGKAVVFAAAGDYDEGGAVGASHSNRLYCIQAVRFIGAGAGKSIIYGHLDTESGDHGDDGRGAAAMRCVRLAGGCVQGFTLRDGRSAYNGGATGKTDATCGGAAYLSGDAAILDCVFTNCVAQRGGCAIGGSSTSQANIFRSRILAGAANGYYVQLFGCVVVLGEGDGAATGTSSDAYFCTGIGTSTAMPFGTGDGICARYVIAHTGDVIGGAAATGWRGCLAWNVPKRNTTTGYVYANPGFVDMAAGDYRVTTASPALTCATLDDETWTCYTSDIEGRPLVFTPDGNPMVGAYQNPVAAYAATAPTGITIAPSGTNTLAAGETVTVTVTDGTRHLKELRVDGVAVAGNSYTYTAPAAGSYENHLVSFEAILSTDWYVNPDGSNDNDGFTKETPMETFEGVMAKVAAGDTVHAAAGVYTNGYTVKEYKEGGGNRARLYIDKANVTVVADGGRDVTFIEGADALITPTKQGLGTNATRCVYVEAVKGVRVKGFTLRKGRTLNIVNDCGAGAYCNNGSLAVADLTVFEDCFFTNNWGWFGAMHSGVAVNCSFVGNGCTKNRAATDGTDLYGCFFDYNTGTEDQGVAYGVPNCAVNCTFGPHNTTAKGALIAAMGSPTAGSEVRNCVFLGGNFGRMSDGTKVATTAYNCAFVTDPTPTVNLTLGTDPILVTADCVDANGKPVAGSALIDAGGNAVLGTTDYLAADAAGGQRVYNGTIDIGAYEYDWRPAYSAALGAGVTVTNASAGVTLSAGTVTLADGATIGGTWEGGDTAKNNRYTVNEGATSGVLTGLFASSTETHESTVTDATRAATFKMLSPLTWSYAFAASVEGGTGTLGSFTLQRPVGIMIFMR